jgi:prepilin peptidase CpaA
MTQLVVRGAGSFGFATVTDAMLSILLLVLLSAGAVLDLRTRRIPNSLTVGGMVVGLMISALPGGIGIANAFASLVIAFVVGIPLFSLRAMGAGDVKFLMAAATFFVPATFLWSLVWIGIAGGILAVAVSIHAGYLGTMVRRAGLLVLSGVTAGKLGARSTLDTPGSLSVPYGLAIAVGCAWAWIGGQL